MIQVRCGKGRVTLLGHAGYAPKGQDVVCAAVSALVYALIGTLRQREQLRELVIRPGYVTVAADGDCGDAFALVRCGLGQLAGAYPAHVAVE